VQKRTLQDVYATVLQHCQSAVATLTRKVFRIGTVRYHWPMSAHASQAFSIASCTDPEDLPPNPTTTTTNPNPNPY